jgi:hypothetical protein
MHYRPPAPVAGATARPNSSVGRRYRYRPRNQELTAHYRPPAPVASGTTLALPLGPTPVWAIPPGPGGRYLHQAGSATSTARAGLHITSTRQYHPAGWRYRLWGGR